MIASYFEFNGVSSKDVGLQIVSFNGDNTGEISVDNEITYNTSKAINNNIWNMHGMSYEKPLTFSFQVSKDICNGINKDLIFTQSEIAYYERWLKRLDGYKFLRFLTDEYENIYYYCTIDVQWYQISGKIVGATLTVTNCAPYAFSPQQSYNITLNENDAADVYNDSDLNGVVDMQLIEIKALASGTIKISNNMESLYMPYKEAMTINNVSSNEVIIINGYTKQISTDQESHEINLDYNYSPICLITYDNFTVSNTINTIQSKRINTLTNLGCACEINISYRTIRQGVI